MRNADLALAPLMPAQAGIQGQALGPRFRGDERKMAGLALPAALRLRLTSRRAFGAPGRAIEMAEEFAKDAQMIGTRFRFTADRAQHVVQGVHQRRLLAVICRSLKRESSRTKSSKRRVAAISARSVR